jgi:hypothetical protein
MATEEKIVYSVEVESGKAGKSLTDLKNDFKESQKELSKLTQGTKEYYDQLKKVASVKDEMGDLRDTIESFKPDQKLKALGNAVTVVSSGFAAAQGAMALFGTENKDLEKTLVKVQAAMAFSQGLQGLQGLGDAFQLLKANLMQFTIFQKIATAAQWLWNAAMNANPVMLIVAGVTALVGAIALLVNAQDDEAEAIERTNELRKIALADREKEIGLVKNKLDLLNKTNDFELEMAKAQGKSKKELYELEKRNIEDRIRNLDRIQMLGRALNAQELTEKAELNKKLALLITKYSTETHNEFVKNSEEQTKKYKEELEKRKKLNKESLPEEIEIATAVTEAQTIATDTYFQNLKDKYAEEDRLKQLRKEQELQDIKDSLEISQRTNQSLMDLSDLYFSVKRANLKKGSAEDLKAAKEQFKINKALAMSGAVITGVQSVMAAYASGLANPIIGPATGALYAAMAGITASANIAKIASSKFNEGGGGGGSIGAIGGGTPPTISAPRNDSTLLNGDGTIVNKPQKEQPTIKAYVVESEITKTQRRVGSIETNAKL